ncbi:50S ribosomal protein L4 [bacterium HR20]|jgi:large subunit ribosomal protein L4|uniref:Large ribosomal subunit protein uL4 n=1 Tax=uncultured Bacteroidota bacterium TaxID=152509 RepID=H5SG09_9BACT|nr:50S ribosomal protein L4 [uncultured Bacteroidetes bacterium]GBD06144.1 50S ribosomal protein L4 [bacterium HR20]
MEVPLYTQTGEQRGTIELPDAVFNIEPHEHAMYLAVRVYLAHQRQGTHKTKTRQEVRGGGRKPWRQKGRGTARAGSIRSPLWVGGGTVFGPQPHKYTIAIPKKVNQLARRSALSCRAREGNIIVVDGIELEQPKTKLMAGVMKALGLEGTSTLMLVDAFNPTVLRAGRNLPYLDMMLADKVSAYHILSHRKLLLVPGAIDMLTTILSPSRTAHEVSA